jgi:membrane-associated phospholipid phosphatase
MLDLTKKEARNIMDFAGKIPVQYNISWARLVSDILSPPVVWGSLAFPIALRDAPSQSEALTWATVYILLVCVLPIMYIALMVRCGRITDIHMQVRQQRLIPFLISIACTAVAWFTLRLMGAPPVVPMFVLYCLIQLALIAGITLVWQISVHAMSISGAAIAAGALFGLGPALLTLPLVFLVGAARLKLRRHTPAQVVAGTVIGVITPLILFVFIAVP